MWKLKKRERYALIEQDTEAPRKHRGTFYIGPRHVKHHSTKEFVEFSYVTAPIFASEKNCRVFAQNSHVAIEIYDYYAKLFDPDYENVSVYDERFDVQYLFKTTPKEDWRSVDYYNPTIQVIPLEDGVEIKRIFDTDYGAQTLEISHVVRTGRRLKHNIKFTNLTVDSKTFRVVMKLTGITSNKVKHKDAEETITAEKHVISPFFFIGEDNQHLKLTEYLWSLGVTDDESGEWTATTLKDIVFDVHAQGCKADIIIGNYTLAQDESLLIDPDSDTWQVNLGTDDCHKDGATFYPSYSYIRAGYRDTTEKIVEAWVRWTSINIPQGATIESAYYKPYGKTYGSAKTRIYGIDEDNTDTFSSDPSGRPLTSAFLDWDPPTWSSDAWRTSPDIKTVIKEIIDRDDWVSGNALGIKHANDGSGTRANNYLNALSFDGIAANAAKLEVTWEAEAPPTGWRKLQYFTEPSTGGQFNKLRFASEPPVSGAWNQLLYENE